MAHGVKISWGMFLFALCLLATVSLLGIVVLSDFDDQSPKHLNDNLSGGVSYEKVLNSPGADWLTYGGNYAATHHSPLNHIKRSNVSSLVPKWVYHVKNSSNLRVAPLVYKDTMFITKAYEVIALNAVSGKYIWHWSFSGSNDGGGIANRGIALLDDKVFIVTADCYLAALDRTNGKFIWGKKYADGAHGYYASLAPLALRDRVIVGVSSGSRSSGRGSGLGFLAAFSASDGKELWRFNTVPAKGEPGYETWGASLDLRIAGGASTWISGSYDPELNLLFWPTGNPRPSFEGRVRPGDNLYSNSVVALDPESGKLKWHFQFLPHDTHDWDASEPLVLVDMVWGDKMRKLLLQANRNGFFYVLDRSNGEFLLGKPFIKKLTWAKGLDKNGRPIPVPGMEGYESKQILCPWIRGATNWMSPSYNPKTKLFYVIVLEQCKGEKGDFYLKAIEPTSGNVRWEYPMPGPSNMTAGTLSTAGGLVFAGDDSGHLIALDAESGELLWQFYMGRAIFASPVTYAVNAKQYVAIAAGSDIFAFSLFNE